MRVLGWACFALLVCGLVDSRPQTPTPCLLTPQEHTAPTHSPQQPQPQPTKHNQRHNQPTPQPTNQPTKPPTRYLTALCFAWTGRDLTAIEGDLCANMMVVSLVLGLNVGAYLGFLWLLAAPK